MMYLIIIVHIYCIVTSKSKDNPQKLSGYGNQCLDFGHASVKHLLISLMHNPLGLNRINGCKKQQLSHQRSSSFGDMALALVLTRTDFVKIKASQFDDLRNRIELPKIPDLTNQASNRYSSNAFDGKNALLSGVV